MMNRKLVVAVFALGLLGPHRKGILLTHGSHVKPGGACAFQNECEGKASGRYYCECPDSYDENGDYCKSNDNTTKKGICAQTLGGGQPCDIAAACGAGTTGCSNETFTCTPVQILCFSGRSTVQVSDVRGTVTLEELRVGDHVRVRDGSFSRVYGFGHKLPTALAKYLQIQTADLKRPIEISSQHLLYVYNRKSDEFELLPAGNVKIGDHLVIVTDNPGTSSPASTSPVTFIRLIQSRGVYAPFTTTGDIAVSGIVASNYIALPMSFQNNPIFALSFAQQHWLQHSFYGPYRFYCGYMKGREGCQTETYRDETGLSSAVMAWLPLLSGVDSLLETQWLIKTRPMILHYFFAAAVGWYLWKYRQASTRRQSADEPRKKA